MSLGGRAGRAVARYLRAEERVVPFHTRPELDELLTWCGTGGRIRMRLVTGDGGAGKTRLALQLCDELEANGWKPLWVRRGTEAMAPTAVQELGTPCVLLVDYAETFDGLEEMLRDIAADSSGFDVRVVLLARGSGEWWQHLVNNSDKRVARLLAAVPPVAVGPVSAERGPGELFDEAVTAFADKLGVVRPDVRLMLTDSDPLVLVVHAAALLAVLGHIEGSHETSARSAAEVLDGLLGHESRYWAQSAAARGLDLDVAVQRLVVAIGCLIGADNETAAVDLMSRIPDLTDSAERRGKVARWLHDLYPETPDVTGAREWIGPLRPDPVAEHLVITELNSRPELIPGLFVGLDNDRAVHALTVLGRAAYTPPRLDLIRKVLAADLEHLAVPAFSVAVRTNLLLGDLLNEALHRYPVSVGTLEQIANMAPYPSIALAPVAATVLALLVDQSADIDQRAKRLWELSSRLAALGRWQEALAAVEKAVAIRREQVEVEPAAFRPELAWALNDQSQALVALGRRGEALAAIDEAVAIRRDLVQIDPGAYLPELAMSLNNLASLQNDLSWPKQALVAGDEAVAIRRELVRDRPDIYPALAGALNNRSNSLAALGRREEALEAIEEATGIYRRLVQDRPDAYLPDFVKNLNNQAIRLSETGRLAEALAACEEALGTVRVLALVRPLVFLADLAGSLFNYGQRLAEAGRRDEAWTAVEEAAEIYRRLADDRPDVFLRNLALLRNYKSLLLAAEGRSQEALAASEEAVAIHRRLAEAQPDAFLPKLAGSLHTYGQRLAEAGRRDEALPVVEEATRILRGLAEAEPDRFLPDFAGFLYAQSLLLGDLLRQSEALPVVEEAIRIYRRLAQDRPDVFLSYVALSLNQQAVYLAQAGRAPETLAAIAEAVEIRRGLAEAQPDALLPDFAGSLHNQGMLMAGMGRRLEALAVFEEAVAIRRRLAEAQPDAFLPDLAKSLRHQSLNLAVMGRQAEAQTAAQEAARIEAPPTAS